MNLRRIFTLSKKEFIHLRNDWWLPAFMLLGGAMELLLVGWATSRPITNLPLIIQDHDMSASSRALIIAVENTGTFDLVDVTDDFAYIEDQMNRGEISAAIIIPPNFHRDLLDLHSVANIAVILNGAESVPATAAQRALEGLVLDFSQDIIIENLNLDPEQLSGFEPSLRVWFNESLSEAYYTTPAELGLMLEFTVLLFAALSFSRERELGTLEQLLVMPFSSVEIIIGKAIPVVIIGMADFVLMLSMVHFIFGVPVRGSLFLLLVLALGYLIIEMGKGLVISVISRTQHQAFLWVLVVGMVDFMFTGYAAPVESMPTIIQIFANFIPAHHWLEIVRGILLKGSGLDVLIFPIGALIILGTIIGTFSLRFVRKALN